MGALISVIIPVYNAEKYLKKCVDSIIRQTHKNLEIILVDDGSTDSGAAICDEYKKTDERIIVIHKKNEGVSSARNAGLDVASGQYIGFVDSDDWIEADMYEKLYNLITRYSADIAICGYIYEKPDGTALSKNRPLSEGLLAQKEALEMALSRHYFKGFVWNKLFKRDLFNSSDRIRFEQGIHLRQDLLCLCECILKSKVIAVTNEYLYHYIASENSAVRQNFKPKRATALDAVEKIRALFEKSCPSLIDTINITWVRTNISLMVSMSKSNYLDTGLIRKIRGNLRGALRNSLISKRLSYKEKIYILLIVINSYVFMRIYRAFYLLLTFHRNRKNLSPFS